MVVGCDFVPGGDPSSYVVNVDNRTSSNLHFSTPSGINLVEKVAAESKGHILYSLGPPASSNLVFRGGMCTTVDIVAYDENETEVARHSPDLCMRDTWVIGSVPAS